MIVDTLTNLAPLPAAADHGSANAEAAVSTAAANGKQTVAAQSATGVPASSKSTPTRDAVELAAQKIHAYLASAGRTLEFRTDNSTGITVVTVKDSETGDVIRQIPSEEVLKLAQTLEESGGKKTNLLLSSTA